MARWRYNGSGPRYIAGANRQPGEVFESDDDPDDLRAAGAERVDEDED